MTAYVNVPGPYEGLSLPSMWAVWQVLHDGAESEYYGADDTLFSVVKVYDEVPAQVRHDIVRACELAGMHRVPADAVAEAVEEVLAAHAFVVWQDDDGFWNVAEFTSREDFEKFEQGVAAQRQGV